MRWRERQPPIDVEAYLPDLRAYLERLNGLVAAWIYGSYGTPYQTPLSDLDMALVFQPGKVPDFRRELTVYGEIQDILHEDDVSVTVINRSPVIFQFRVLETGRLLVSNDPVALADFVERVLIKHGDYITDHEEFVREYDRAFSEHYSREA